MKALVFGLDEERPDIAIGFPGGTGTADMATRCLKAGVKLLRLHAVPTTTGGATYRGEWVG